MLCFSFLWHMKHIIYRTVLLNNWSVNKVLLNTKILQHVYSHIIKKIYLENFFYIHYWHILIQPIRIEDLFYLLSTRFMSIFIPENLSSILRLNTTNMSSIFMNERTINFDIDIDIDNIVGVIVIDELFPQNFLNTVSYFCIYFYQN